MQLPDGTRNHQKDGSLIFKFRGGLTTLDLWCTKCFSVKKYHYNDDMNIE